MGKSKYPEKYDTSIEIPVIRGNINELSVDYLNSLRSALLQIQHTLGIMPQGAATGTVADRLSKSLDSSGSIKKESLDSAGVIYGPITNDNISKVAAIDEAKLKLDFPTKVLQTEYSLVSAKLNEIIAELEAVISQVGSHVYVDAPNRHSGKSIKISEILVNPSDLAVAELAVTNAQDAIESIFSGHINYSGANITNENNSHLSKQIFFDNTNVSDDIAGADLQTVVEELVPIARNSQIKHQDLFHSNGYLNAGIISLAKTTTSIASNLSVVFLKPSISNTTRKTKISLITPQEIFGLKEYDYISVNLSTGDSFYTISDIELDSSNLVQSFYVYGNISEDSTGSSVISIFKAENTKTPTWGLATTVIESPSLLSANMVKIADPNAPGVVSVGFKTNSITSSKRYIGLEVSGKTYQIDCYNSLKTYQTIDSVVSAMNESLSESGAPAFAYKVDGTVLDQTEIAIVLNIKEKDSYIKLTRVDDAIDLTGFSIWEDREVYPTTGATHVVNGKPFEGLNELMNLTGLLLESGASISGTNFLNYNLKVNDILNIIGTDSDDGSYIITNITSTRLYVNSSQLSGGTWTGASSVTSKFIVYNDVQSFDSYNFIKTSGSPAGLLFELVLNESNNLHYRTIAEYQSPVFAGSSLFAIIDCNQENYKIEKNITFEIIGFDLYCYIESSNKIKISDYKNYPISLQNNEYDSIIKLYIYNGADILGYVTSLGVTTLQIAVTIYEKKSYENVLSLATASFYATNGRIEGGPERTPYIARYLDTGSISLDQVSKKVKKDFQEITYKETRSNGVSRGLELLSVSLDVITGKYIVSISSGIAYINGKRFKLDAITDWSTNLNYADFDKIIIAINSDGIIIADSANLSDCTFYINQDEYAIIGTIEYNGWETSIIDQRLFINDLDLKLINSVTVSPQAGLGHFTSVNKAIKYAKRFSQLFPDAGTPEVLLKAGTHKIVVDVGIDYGLASNQSFINSSDESGILIDFPVKIIGEGDSSVLDIINVYNDYPESGDDRANDAKNKGYIVIIGSGASSYHAPFSSDKLNSDSVLLKDFKIKNSTILYLDPQVSLAGDTNENFQYLKIENIYFDWSNIEYVSTFATSYYFNNANAFFLETDDVTSGSVGNFSIKDCTFDNCFIDLSNSGVSYQNITISGNQFFARGQVNNFAYPSILIKTNPGAILNNGPVIFNNSGKITSLFNCTFYSSDGLAILNNLNNLLWNGNVSIGYDTISLDGTLSVTDSIEASSAGFTVTAPATFNGLANFSAAITADGIATFNDEANFNAAANFNDAANFNSTVDITGILTASGGIYASGPIVTIDTLLFLVKNLAQFTNNVYVAGDFDVAGTVSAAVKAFKIEHPDPSKNNMYLTHSTVETNTPGDNIYRWSLDLEIGDNFIKLEDYHPYLNGNEMIWISPVGHFGAGYGNVDKDKNELIITVNNKGKYNILLICTRIDPATKLWKGVEVLKKE